MCRWPLITLVQCIYSIVLWKDSCQKVSAPSNEGIEDSTVVHLSFIAPFKDHSIPKLKVLRVIY